MNVHPTATVRPGARLNQQLFCVFWRSAFASVLFATLACSGRAADEATQLPQLRWHEPAPELLEAASKEGAEITGLPTPSGDVGVPPSEASVTALVVHEERTRTRQWLIRLVARELNEKEKALPPRPTERFYTSSGQTIAFSGELAAIAIQVIGPVTVSPEPSRPSRAPKAKWSGALVNGDFLGLGLANASRALHQLGQQADDQQINAEFSWRTDPYPAEVHAATQQALASLDFTPEHERALVGSTPALFQFFTIAAGTPGVRDILQDFLDLSAWKIITRGMPKLDIRLLPGAAPIDLSSWGFAMPAQGFPFILKLDGKPKLVCSLAVADPVAPYAVSAGVLAMAIERADGSDSRLGMRLLSAHLTGQPTN